MTIKEILPLSYNVNNWLGNFNQIQDSYEYFITLKVDSFPTEGNY